jgi:hypothetical protein
MRRIFAGAAGAALVAGCAAFAPPAHLAVNGIWNLRGPGFVHASYYYSESQLKDPRWEARRLANLGRLDHCPTDQQVISRDVRWFEATEESVIRCAAVIYTVRCGARAAGPMDEIERRRQSLLRQHFDAPIEKGCGEKDQSRLPDVTDHDRDVENRRKIVATISRSARCPVESSRPTKPLRSFPQTRFSLETRLDRRFGELQLRSPRTVTYDPGFTQRRIAWAHDRAGLVEPAFLPPDELDNDRYNIRLVQTYALNRAGTGYCVVLEARQAGRVWRRAIERPRMVKERGHLAMDSSGRSLDPANYWTPFTDMILLTDALIADLGLPTLSQPSES